MKGMIETCNHIGEVWSADEYIQGVYHSIVMGGDDIENVKLQIQILRLFTVTNKSRERLQARERKQQKL